MIEVSANGAMWPGLTQRVSRQDLRGAGPDGMGIDLLSAPGFAGG